MQRFCPSYPNTVHSAHRGARQAGPRACWPLFRRRSRAKPSGARNVASICTPCVPAHVFGCMSAPFRRCCASSFRRVDVHAPQRRKGVGDVIRSYRGRKVSLCGLLQAQLLQNWRRRPFFAPALPSCIPYEFGERRNLVKRAAFLGFCYIRRSPRRGGVSRFELPSLRPSDDVIWTGVSAYRRPDMLPSGRTSYVPAAGGRPAKCACLQRRYSSVFLCGWYMSNGIALQVGGAGRRLQGALGAPEFFQSSPPPAASPIVRPGVFIAAIKGVTSKKRPLLCRETTPQIQSGPC